MCVVSQSHYTSVFPPEPEEARHRDGGEEETRADDGIGTSGHQPAPPMKQKEKSHISTYFLAFKWSETCEYARKKSPHFFIFQF